MYIIPENVQLTSIENTSGRHIIITAQAEEYQYLGYFVGKIKLDEALTNVTTTFGNKQSNVITVQIEGELP